MNPWFAPWVVTERMRARQSVRRPGPVEALAELLDDLAVEPVVPPRVTWQGNRLSRAQRVTVFGDTPSSFETSDRVRNCVPAVPAVVASFFSRRRGYVFVLDVRMRRMPQGRRLCVLPS